MIKNKNNKGFIIEPRVMLSAEVKERNLQPSKVTRQNRLEREEASLAIIEMRTSSNWHAFIRFWNIFANWYNEVSRIVPFAALVDNGEG